MANEFGKEMETEKKFSQMVREQKSTIYINSTWRKTGQNGGKRL